MMEELHDRVYPLEGGKEAVSERYEGKEGMNTRSEKRCTGTGPDEGPLLL
jgi:hypothetical protein